MFKTKSAFISLIKTGCELKRMVLFEYRKIESFGKNVLFPNGVERFLSIAKQSHTHNIKRDGQKGTGNFVCVKA
jgi:hypothetical protein